ncbi:SPRY domain-containing protein [Trichinella spiralis]|uniref:SPRY domain-containing protein n=1 Tax=Trichinella spiralis TaxID=6334 RepID=A0ABR3KVN8_TRISP
MMKLSIILKREPNRRLSFFLVIAIPLDKSNQPTIEQSTCHISTSKFTAVMVNCLRMCLECVQGPSFFGTNHVRLHDVASICLDSERSGENVVLLKDSTRICGSGASLCTAPLLQDNSYFEIKIQQAGSWGVGIASPDVDLNRIPLGKDMKSCVLRCDGKVYRNDQVVCESSCWWKKAITCELLTII